MMNVTTSQLKSEPKKVGTLDGDDVCEIQTKGGLVMIVAKSEGGKMKTLGVGPHVAVARYIAKEREGAKLNWTELSKSAKTQFDAGILPSYRSLTDRFQTLPK
jgi:hypothetical protein